MESLHLPSSQACPRHSKLRGMTRPEVYCVDSTKFPTMPRRRRRLIQYITRRADVHSSNRRAPVEAMHALDGRSVVCEVSTYSHDRPGGLVVSITCMGVVEALVYFF